MTYDPTYTSADEMLTNLPSSYAVEAGGNNHKYFVAAQAALWQGVVDDIATIRSLSHVPNMTGEALDNWGAGTLDLPRFTNEGDAAYLLRIKGEVRRRIGGSSTSDVIDFINLVVGGGITSSDITITENTDESTGAYRAGYYTVSINTSLLLSKGFTSAQIPDALQQIEDILNETAAAGVEAKVLLGGGAEWDTDVYDDPDAIWGN